MTLEVVMVAREPRISDLIRACAEKRIMFDELCERVEKMGYKTTSLYEMVRGPFNWARRVADIGVLWEKKMRVYCGGDVLPQRSCLYT